MRRVFFARLEEEGGGERGEGRGERGRRGGGGGGGGGEGRGDGGEPERRAEARSPHRTLLRTLASPPLPLAGEGWGEGGASERGGIWFRVASRIWPPSPRAACYTF